MSDYSVFRKYTVERYDVSSCGDMNCEPLVSSHDGAYVAHEDFEVLMAEAERNAKNAAEWEAASLHWMAERDQLKAENAKFDEGMRSMACSLGAGGYNAETLTADQLVDKVQWGLTNLADSSAKLLDQVRAERDQLFGQTEQLKAENDRLKHENRLLTEHNELLASSDSRLAPELRAVKDALGLDFTASVIGEVVPLIERLRKLPTCWSEVLEQSEANDQLLDQVLELSKDAERWRFLRDDWPKVKLVPNGDWFNSCFLEREIDAAIAKTR